MYNKKEKEFETTRHITVIESFAREVKIRVSQDSTNQKKKKMPINQDRKIHTRIVSSNRKSRGKILHNTSS